MDSLAKLLFPRQERWRRRRRLKTLLLALLLGIVTATILGGVIYWQSTHGDLPSR